MFSRASHRLRYSLQTLPLLLLTIALLASTALAQQEKVLHTFANVGTSGGGPYSPLVFDAAGNLYGTSLEGGAYNDGIVFELSPRSGGGWTTKVLHNFRSQNGTDGAFPYSGLIFDAAGNLYGTTQFGGTYGQGTVYELMPQASGSWVAKILHSFNANGGDGYQSFAGLIFDAAGNLYGSTVGGGAHSGGTVFELSPQSGGTWAETILYNFCSQASCTDGSGVYSGLIFDKAGNLYGTTSTGGAYKGGTVFELTPQSTGGWNEAVIFNFNKFAFNGSSGAYDPFAALIFDASGNLYGTTDLGGTFGGGTVFELIPQNGVWKAKSLHSFNNNGVDGYTPGSSLVFDASGNLYGTTVHGGGNGFGSVYKLTPTASGAWTEMILHSFNNTDGAQPYAGLVPDDVGNLFGATFQGGPTNNGLVFEIVP